MASEPIRVQEPIRFGEDFQIDVNARRLRRNGHTLKLERIPLEILVLLVENRGGIVTRDEIVAKVWGKDVFLDTDNSIRGAIRKIRQVLKDDPEQPRFIQTVTGQGYRFIAAVAPAEKDLAIKGGRSLVEKHRVPRTSHARARYWVVLAGVGALALIATAYVIARNRTRQVAPPKVQSIAVLPLKNLSGDPSQEYFADGMTEALIGRLSGIRDLRVISRTSVMRFKDTNMSAPEIAKALQVDAIVEGSVQREGTRVRVHAQLIRGATDEHFWSEAYDRELRDILSLQSDVAQSIAEKVQVTVTGQEHSRLVAARHVSPDVYENYLRGNFGSRNSRPEIEKSIEYFEEAIRKDPTFAPAYVGLASAYDAMGLVFIGAPPSETRPKEMSAAQKALELDPEIAEAHVRLADVYQRQWQWSAAEAEYKKALELKPNDASALVGYANWLLCQGRIDEALASSQRARDVDPLGASGVNIGWILFHARRYDEAIRELRSVLAVRPNTAIAHWFLGFVLIAKGQPDQAIPELEKTVSMTHRNPGSIEILAMAYARAGRRSEALHLMNELKQRRKETYVPAGAFINPYIGLGDYDQVFAGFERAYQEQSNIMQFLKVHPFFDPIREDPRFKDLVRRVGLN